MTENEINSRDDEKFVENNKNCDFETFFEFFDLSFFFLVCAKKTNVETKKTVKTKKVDDEHDENDEEFEKNEKESKIKKKN